MLRRAGDYWVRVIGVFKALKGLLLIAVGTDALRMLHKDLAEILTRWIERFNMDPHSHLFRAVIEKVARIDSHKLLLYTIGTFFYAALFLTEGIGLILVKRWAEYFAVIITGSFLPLEIYEAVKRLSPIKFAIILINAAIVVYLIIKIKRGRRSQRM